MLHTRTLLLGLLCIALAPLAAQPRTLDELLARKEVMAQVKPLGGFRGLCIRLGLKNVSARSLEVEVPAGQMMISRDSSVQDLVVTRPAFAQLAPGQVQYVDVYTMCTQAGNMAPSTSEAFTVGKRCEGPLLDLVQLIAREDIQNSSAQSAVWAVCSGAPVSQVFGEDSRQIHLLAEQVSEATGQPLSSFDLRPRPHRLTSFKASLEGLLPYDLPAADLGLYDGSGRLLYACFQGRAVERGYVQWRVGINHTLGDSTPVFLRLFDRGELVLERALQAGDSVTPLHALRSQVAMSYEVASPVKAEAGIYDSEGHLYLVIANRMNLQPGFHRSTFVAETRLPVRDDYWVEIRADGQVLARRPLDLHAPAGALQPRKEISGSSELDIREAVRGGRMAIYDARGEMVALLFEAGSVQPGKRRLSWRFGHREGSGARFYLRLSDGEGRVVAEAEIISP